MTIAEAYAVCRGIARREAKNFYYAFLALPPHKRNAICAVYAFMRHADDLSDDESVPLSERRVRLAAWRAAWHTAATEGGSTDPVFRALNDARVRFRIPLTLLEQLVDGTAMDLDEEQGANRSFADFAGLRRYCYLVASVVGLVCIRIFGYRSPRAVQLAEELGIAFQLTNILRDVKEDAERGRVYLPEDELARHGLTPAELTRIASEAHQPDARLRAMLAEQAARAEQLYSSGAALLPLIEADSRPALWVLISIYHRLLERIVDADYDVLTQRVRVPTWQKLLLLMRGLAGTLRARTRRRSSRVNLLPTKQPRRIAIVGAGVAGLSAGCALSAVGHSVVIFERRPYVGGRASSYLHPGSGRVIDNCQHILLGCCTSLRALLAQTGRDQAISWTSTITYLEPGGRSSRITPSPLPAPLHGAPGFLAARCFSSYDKRVIGRGVRALLRRDEADVPGGEDFLGWARRHGQSEAALRRFWDPILKSALNDDLSHISVHYAAKVVRESFLNSAEAGRIGVPRLPLSELYSGAAQYVEGHEGAVRLRANVTGLEQIAAGWRVHADGTFEEFDDVILALPHGPATALLPAGKSAESLRAFAAGMQTNALVGVHLFFDRPITPLPHAVLLDATIQWMYQQPAPEGTGCHLELVVSAARELVPQSQAAILELAVRELALFFPEVRSAQLVKGIVTKEVHATFAVPPGLDASRPSQSTEWAGLYIAGDWTDTGWPATMEGAARSGFLAAEALTGQPMLPPDLSPRGFMRLLS